MDHLLMAHLQNLATLSDVHSNYRCSCRWCWEGEKEKTCLGKNERSLFERYSPPPPPPPFFFYFTLRGRESSKKTTCIWLEAIIAPSRTKEIEQEKRTFMYEARKVKRGNKKNIQGKICIPVRVIISLTLTLSENWAERREGYSGRRSWSSPRKETNLSLSLSLSLWQTAMEAAKRSRTRTFLFQYISSTSSFTVPFEDEMRIIVFFDNHCKLSFALSFCQWQNVSVEEKSLRYTDTQTYTGL